MTLRAEKLQVFTTLFPLTAASKKMHLNQRNKQAMISIDLEIHSYFL